jgi:hypothetical protein
MPIDPREQTAVRGSFPVVGPAHDDLVAIELIT